MLNISLAEPQRHQALTLFPLVTADEAELPYELLVDALHAGTLAITEVGVGTVPELLATYGGDQDLLLLDGEQLVGARQNRMINRTILLPGRSKTTIPVSCMEQGRWHFTSEKFAPTESCSPAAVRRRARESEADYAEAGMAAPPEALSNAQYAVWDAIAEHTDKLGGRSPTHALNDLYDLELTQLTDWQQRFPHVPGQVGLLAFVGERPLGMDVIGGRNLYARLHERLLRGYIMDALQVPAPTRKVAPEAAQEFLGRAQAASRIASPTVGKGTYHVLSGAAIGGELHDGERIVHLSAFPSEERDAGRAAPAAAPPPVAPPSRRRRAR